MRSGSGNRACARVPQERRDREGVDSAWTLSRRHRTRNSVGELACCSPRKRKEPDVWGVLAAEQPVNELH